MHNVTIIVGHALPLIDIDTKKESFQRNACTAWACEKKKFPPPKIACLVYNGYGENVNKSYVFLLRQVPVYVKAIISILNQIFEIQVHLVSYLAIYINDGSFKSETHRYN